MAFDYRQIVATVDELIPQFGRAITLMKTPRAAADADKPWNGPAEWNDANHPPGHSLSVDAIFVGGAAKFSGTRPPFVADEAGSLIRRGNSGYLVSGSVNSDLRQFDRIDDGGQLWKINAVNVLQPGPTVLLYGLEVSQ